MNNNTYKISAALVAFIIGGIISGVAVFYLAQNGIITVSPEPRVVSSDQSTKADYTIPNIPYFGAYNRMLYPMMVDDATAAESSILEYWNRRGNNLTEVRRSVLEIFNQHGYVGESSVISYFRGIGEGDYVATSKFLTLDELSNYINEDVRTPLLFFLPVSKEQRQDNTYHPAVLLIGVNYSQRKVILHSSWFGNNYEISFDDFTALQSLKRPDEQNSYIIVQPKDFNKKITLLRGALEEEYPTRTTIMENGGVMFGDFALGRHLSSINRLAESNDYFLNIEKNPQFEEYFPPVYKVRTFSSLSANYLRTGNLELASTYAQKAVSMNHDMDKPFKDWPGYKTIGTTGELRTPYEILGNVYLAQKDYKKAVTAYDKAVKDFPSPPDRLLSNLSIAQIELAKIK